MKPLESVLIKPHHLLDIFKLYGKGIDEFVPDTAYHHDFYLLANAIVKRKTVRVTFTDGEDRICAPCKFNQNGRCVDCFELNGEQKEKEEFNVQIDNALIKALGLRFGMEYGMDETVLHLRKNISAEMVQKVWHKRTAQENEERYRLTKAGLDKY